MSYKADILLGKITKTYGFDGTVVVRLGEEFTGDISELKSVFLEIEGKAVPFIIIDANIPGRDFLRLRFYGYDTLEKVTEFTGCNVFLTSGSKSKKSAGIKGDLKGFKVMIADEKILGTVTRIIENPGQSLLSVKNNKGKDILIPLHDDLITVLDSRKKLIKMDLPEGLTEIE